MGRVGDGRREEVGQNRGPHPYQAHSPDALVLLERGTASLGSSWS